LLVEMFLDEEHCVLSSLSIAYVLARCVKSEGKVRGSDFSHEENGTCSINI